MHTGFRWGSLREGETLGRPWRRWENGIKMDVREVGWKCMDWIDLAQDRDRWQAVVNTAMNLWVQ